MDRRVITDLEKYQVLFNYKNGNSINKINQVLNGSFSIYFYYEKKQNFIKDKNQVLQFYLRGEVNE